MSKKTLVISFLSIFKSFDNIMKKGIVKWYDETKGFGFITSDEGEEVFVHMSNLDSPYSGLEQDESVTFKVKKGDKGLVALNVKTV